MQPDDQAALCKRLAEEIMEWKLLPYNPDTDRGFWAEDGVEFSVFTTDNWKPYKDIAQAFMVAEKIGGLELVDVQGKRWKATFGENYHRADTPALAICLAADAWLKGKWER